MIIRAIRKGGEIPLLAEFLYEAVFCPEGAAPLPRSMVLHPSLRIYIDGFGSRRDDRCQVADNGGRIVGAVWTRRIRAYGFYDVDTPELAVSVLPQWRGCGIGTRLLTEMERLLRSGGYPAVSLSVQRENPAVRLYLRAGFVVAAGRGSEYLMVKKYLPL